MKKFLLAFFLLLFLSFTYADIKLPAIIGSNMVLQRNMKVNIWGWADPGEKIEIKAGFFKNKISTIADEKGKWSVKIPTEKAGGPFEILFKGKNEIVLKNILVGEVWICSGQSNMERYVKLADSNYINEIKIEIETKPKDFAALRLFTVKHRISFEPLDTCQGEWKTTSLESIANFSAVAYFFGRELQKKLKVPVGLICSAWSGTPVESWTKREVIVSDTDFIKLINRFESDQNKGSTLFNGMINPVTKYGIKGAIWYQGESNRNEPDIYARLFPAMIKNWREEWKQGDFPFYFVQIAPFSYKEIHSGALLREAQLKSLNTPNTGMAVTMDIGDITDIHPKNKKDVGIRLSLWALANTYGKKDIIFSGPLYKDMKIENDKIRLSFNYVGSGLDLKGKELSDFEIAGEDRKFYPAKAEIDKNLVLVYSSEVKNPVAVRYAFTNTSQPNLFNKEGLPASSFRTDNWPIYNQTVSVRLNLDSIKNEYLAILKSNDSTAEIRFTLDGTKPDLYSPKYDNPIKLHSTTDLTMRAFVRGQGSLATNNFNYIKSASIGKKIMLKNKFGARFRGNGENSIIDGALGTEILSDGFWQGYEGCDFEAVIDFNSVIDIYNVNIGFLQEIGAWIFFPKTVELSISEDGREFKTISIMDNDIPENKPGTIIKRFKKNFIDIKGRFLKVYAKSLRTCPWWHSGNGRNCWLFIDEISVNEITETGAEREKRMIWWKDSKFGMFIHWGIYSVLAGEYKGKETCAEWIMDCSKIPVPEYEKYAALFNPVKFSASEWVRLAKDAGMKYIVITSKHHDGFSMWDSKVSDYDIIDRTPFKRDVLKELAEACKKENIRFCIYHSIMDWHHPMAKGKDFSRYREEYLKPQLKELLTNYGPVGVLWFDGEWISEWTEPQGKELYNFVKSLQPDIIINNRVGKGRMGMAGISKDPNYVGDFGTPEQEIPEEGLQDVDWESCMTMNDNWGYKAGDHNFKSTRTLILNLIDVVSKGGNLLLNIGPTSEGLIPEESIKRLKEVSEWMKINNEAIYTTKMYKTYKEGENIHYTFSGDKRFVYAFYSGQNKDMLVLKNVSAKSGSQIQLLGYSKTIDYKQKENELIINLPADLPKSNAFVFKIEAEPYVEKPKILSRKKIYVDENPKINIICDTKDAVIHYTMDNSEPTKSSSVYSMPLNIIKSCRIKAKAFKEGLSESLIAGQSIYIVNSNVNGLNYKYYEGNWKKIPDFNDLKPARAGRVYEISIDAVNPAEDNFGVQFEGFLNIEKEGEYTFYLKSDDGSRLFINNDELIDNDGLHGSLEKSERIKLKKGLIPIRIEFFEQGGDQKLELSFKGPEIEKQAVPPSMFVNKK